MSILPSIEWNAGHVRTGWGVAGLDSLVENMRHSDWTPSRLDDLPGLLKQGSDMIPSQSASGAIGIEYEHISEQGSRALLETSYGILP